MNNVDIPSDSIRCRMCARQIIPRRIVIPRTLPKAIPQHAKWQAQDALAHPTVTEAVSAGCPRADQSSPVLRQVPHVGHRAVIDQAPVPLYCSEECRLADLHSYHGAIDTKNSNECSSPRVPPDATHAHEHQIDRDSSGASVKSPLSTTTRSATAETSPPTRDYGAAAYSRLAAFYGFAPLPPRPSFAAEARAPAQTPCLMEGGLILAVRRMQAALCTKTIKVLWGLPIETDPEEDNKPIPGWTDGSNAWRASVYGLAPPRDFSRTDPDDAAIRAYGSFVASTHRSRGARSTPGRKPADDKLNASGPLSSLQSPPMDPCTHELYRKYAAAISQRLHSRRRASLHAHGASFSTSPHSTCACLVREVPLVKPGAEGRLEVPNVKLRRTIYRPSGVNAGAACGTTCSLSTAGPVRPTATCARSYESERFTYSILRSPPTLEKRIERRWVDGQRCDVEVEVEVERPIKRLFLFGGARD